MCSQEIKRSDGWLKWVPMHALPTCSPTSALYRLVASHTRFHTAETEALVFLSRHRSRLLLFTPQYISFFLLTVMKYRTFITWRYKDHAYRPVLPLGLYRPLRCALRFVVLFVMSANVSPSSSTHHENVQNVYAGSSDAACFFLFPRRSPHCVVITGTRWHR